MKKQWEGFVSGILVSMLLVGMIATAMATVGQRTVNVDYNDIKVTMNGSAVNLVDANGAAVEPFAINGTTYLPVRAVSSALGLEVDWDGKTNTVVLTTKEKTNPILDSQPKYHGEKHLLSPGQVFDAGGYVLVDGVEFLYDGERFCLTNNRTDFVRQNYYIVGVKANGAYDMIQSGSFNGVDEQQYQKDLQENGWAIKQGTNLIRPGETLIAEFSVFDFGGDYPNPDIDGDGYYDIVFAIHPQQKEEGFRISTDDPESEVYKIKVK